MLHSTSMFVISRTLDIVTNPAPALMNASLNSLLLSTAFHSLLTVLLSAFPCSQAFFQSMTLPSSPKYSALHAKPTSLFEKNPPCLSSATCSCTTLYSFLLLLRPNDSLKLLTCSCFFTSSWTFQAASVASSALSAGTLNFLSSTYTVILTSGYTSMENCPHCAQHHQPQQNYTNHAAWQFCCVLLHCCLRTMLFCDAQSSRTILVAAEL